MNKKELRKLECYFYEHPICWYDIHEGLMNRLIEKYNIYLSCLETNYNTESNYKHKIYEVIEIINNNNLTESEIISIATVSSEKYNNNSKRMKINTCIETRDNKKVFNKGSGYSSGHPSVRYPRKNRSRKTWSNFYKLFPYYAELDGWDGKKSKKYNG